MAVKGTEMEGRIRPMGRNYGAWTDSVWLPSSPRVPWNLVMGRNLYVRIAGADTIDGAERCRFLPRDLKKKMQDRGGSEVSRAFGGV